MKASPNCFVSVRGDLLFYWITTPYKINVLQTYDGMAIGGAGGAAAALSVPLHTERGRERVNLLI